MKDLLPDSRPRIQKNVTRMTTPWGVVNYVPVYCANCGVPYGLVPNENMTFAFWLCNLCAEKWAPLEGTYTIPDEVFAQKIAEELMTYGRDVTMSEITEILKDENSSLAKLCKDKPDFHKFAMT
jgi:hypothetical protein